MADAKAIKLIPIIMLKNILNPSPSSAFFMMKVIPEIASAMAEIIPPTGPATVPKTFSTGPLNSAIPLAEAISGNSKIADKRSKVILVLFFIMNVLQHVFLIYRVVAGNRCHFSNRAACPRAANENYKIHGRAD